MRNREKKKQRLLIEKMSIRNKIAKNRSTHVDLDIISPLRGFDPSMRSKMALLSLSSLTVVMTTLNSDGRRAVCLVASDPVNVDDPLLAVHLA